MLSACFAALVAIKHEAAVPFVARFLAQGGDAAAEAAFALAETRSAAALDALLTAHRNPSLSHEPWLGEVLLSAIALTRLPAALDYLIGLIGAEHREAAAAIEAILKCQPGEQIMTRLGEAVEAVGSPRLSKAFRGEAADEPRR